MTARRRRHDNDLGAEPGPEARRRPRVQLQRGIIILPSAFTLGNLFFGIYAIIAATRGDFEWAGWFIIFAGILDMLDGRVARFTRTGSRFGAELDSLVDAISFGVAPGVIMYQIFFQDATSWSWTLSYVYIVATVVRLARFNVEQGGEAKRYFLGLPSPAAGMTLASWYPFSQTALFETYLSDLPWPQIMAIGMVLIGVLMVSHVPYAKVPRLGLRTTKGRLTTAWIGTLLVLAITVPRYYFFSALFVYIVWGLVKTVSLGLLDRLPDRDPLLDEPDDDDDYDHSRDTRTLDYSHLNPEPRRAAPPPPENDT
ncbi:MAG: CDP-diacylglycerol--serine O-phosphatidyltransferase [Gemmatimonadetes bacterium]|nr:CDP-diacylglycerol--serine O-phosphatidyltransferase [Gemmatimonadota bacterium]MBT8404176.1 CDP-diacylglycerol--serine O-phosphatidyltransferase [Gemmatimonadota bacterium]NNK63570.1 CDP-diacylglycerol--serine O-phosphatidyltransferase [Gemmatimonadota bacterium]